ncbi:hypothetical protein F5144DRAFT_651607 [Chaetomium tenue]|uniref:Uncharacterized protein n=1 Tax=Chaetomium tenue TaxID=1854479 RepID=A0ACB7P0W8_9PEZI|nr:hypothetical protein F5144DRAFT_651607 [Chaetomium globosum]
MRPSLLLTLPLAHLAHAAINWDVYEHGVVPSFQWSRPFPEDGTDPGGFQVLCRHAASFAARMYKLRDLAEAPPSGLAPWRGGIEAFLKGREYVGSWDGVDHKGEDRELVVMEWGDVPEGVRAWIEEQKADESEANEKKWLFGVFDKPEEKVAGGGEAESGREGQQEAGKASEVASGGKIVVFPAGALYEILPLWVAKGSGCERDLNNLAKYKPRAGEDHSVLAWPVDHTKPQRDLGKRDITFKIEALSVVETEEGKKSRLMWEKMHRTIKRNERRQQREERQKAKEEIKNGWVRDEL